MSHVVTDTEAVRAAVRQVQRAIQGPTSADFWGVEFRYWAGLASDIMCDALMEGNNYQFHRYIQDSLATPRGDWMVEFLDQVFEVLGIEVIDQLWP